MEVSNVRVTVVGDALVGKTCLLIAYTTKEFAENDNLLDIFNNYTEELVVDKKHYKISLWDIAGEDHYQRLRDLVYPHTTCFLLCYSINSGDSFDNIRTKWAPEIRQSMRHTPIILVGTKCDLRLRDDPNLNLITQKQGQDLAKKLAAKCYLECSALELEGLDQIMIAAVRASSKPSTTTKRRKCAVL